MTELENKILTCIKFLKKYELTDQLQIAYLFYIFAILYKNVYNITDEFIDDFITLNVDDFQNKYDKCYKLFNTTRYSIVMNFDRYNIDNNECYEYNINVNTENLNTFIKQLAHKIYEENLIENCDKKVLKIINNNGMRVSTAHEYKIYLYLFKKYIEENKPIDIKKYPYIGLYT